MERARLLESRMEAAGESDRGGEGGGTGHDGSRRVGEPVPQGERAGTEAERSGRGATGERSGPVPGTAPVGEGGTGVHGDGGGGGRGGRGGIDGVDAYPAVGSRSGTIPRRR